MSCSLYGRSRLRLLWTRVATHTPGLDQAARYERLQLPAIYLGAAVRAIVPGWARTVPWAEVADWLAGDTDWDNP